MIQVDHVFHISKEFFSLSDDTKIKYIRTSDTNNNGYVKMQQERQGNIVCSIHNYLQMILFIVIVDYISSDLVIFVPKPS